MTKPIFLPASLLEDNVFLLSGAVAKALKEQGRYDEARELPTLLEKCQSHAEAKALMSKYANFVNEWGATVKVAQLGDDFMPAGEYIVADPCYILDEKIYDNLIAGEVAFESEKPHEYADGYKLVILHTKHGDGSYTGSDGHEYYVDSGTIAAIQIPANPTLWFRKGWNASFHARHTATKPFVCETDNDGVLTFGDLVSIETDGHRCEYCDDRYCEACEECGDCPQRCDCWDSQNKE